MWILFILLCDIDERFSKLPVILKGIITHEDARLAAKSGCKAIIVSNHGARQLDTGSTKMLPFPLFSNQFQPISPSFRCHASLLNLHKHWIGKLFTVPATIEALAEIVEAVGDQLTVMIDGGIRNGM